MHFLILLIQKRKGIRAWLTSVSFQIQEHQGECSGFCQFLGVKDRVGSCATLCHSKTIICVFLWMSYLKFIVLVADSKFPLRSYLLSFTLLGIEKEKLCREALTHYLYPKMPLQAFWDTGSIPAFRSDLYQCLWNTTGQAQIQSVYWVLGTVFTSPVMSQPSRQSLTFCKTWLLKVRFRNYSQMAVLPSWGLD